jgi:C-methyltransferase-like protein/putative zinc binding protein/methyltransferase family protein
MIAPIYRRRETCRACDGRALRSFLSLGPQPLANAFPRSPAEFAGEQTFPLDVCLCETCGLVQIMDVIDPEVLFRDYIYMTGTSLTIAEHYKRYAETVVEMLGLGPADLVAEAASNDGSLLKCFRAHGVRTLGIEPARNIAAMARRDGIESLEVFFGAATGQAVRGSHGPARAVIGNNVLAHVDDTRDFLRGGAALLADDGLVITEVPYLGEFVERLEYDTVYHEHLCYFSVTALMRLCEEVGLRIVRVDQVPVHGGSIRMYAGLAARHPAHAPEVAAMADRERRDGLTSLPRFTRLADDVAATRDRLVRLLGELRTAGKSVAGYGAPAKGNTLLNYCGIGTDLVPYTVDKSPLKIGRYTPGMHLPVLAPETIAQRRPDYLLILAWNFADEIMGQQRAFHEQGGRFILPLPMPRIC